MKRVFLIITCVLTALGARSQGVNFQEITLDKAMKQAGEEGKMVFVDCYTVWCGPCKQMANVEFPKPEAGAYFNAKFVNVKFDMEKGEGKEIAARYGVNIYPTFLVLTPEGTEVNRVIGSLPMAEFIPRVDKATAPGADLRTMTDEYASGKMSVDRARDFILVLRNAHRDSLAKVVTDDLMGRLTDDQKCSADFWPLFRDQAIVPASSPRFLFLLDNLEAFRQAVGEEEVARRLRGFRYLDEYLNATAMYNAGERGKSFLLGYATTLMFSPERSREVADELYRSLSKRERVDTTYWPLFHLLAFNQWGDERFNYLLEKRKDFRRSVGEGRVDQTIRYGYVHKLSMVIKGYDKSTTAADFHRMIDEARRYKIAGVAPLVNLARASVYGDAAAVLEACREALPMFDDNLALNLISPVMGAMKGGLDEGQRGVLRALLVDLAGRMRSDTVRKLVEGLNV
ncbi:MAG: thioredoxin family protein [Odoribacteraceae bacterium]|jgi:thiol-disulfide isomerase/thioredoxin|nr:thioredoxin family protein [Odoribacteraceae bacterium]